MVFRPPQTCVSDAFDGRGRDEMLFAIPDATPLVYPGNKDNRQGSYLVIPIPMSHRAINYLGNAI